VCVCVFVCSRMCARAHELVEAHFSFVSRKAWQRACALSDLGLPASGAWAGVQIGCFWYDRAPAPPERFCLMSGQGRLCTGKASVWFCPLTRDPADRNPLSPHDACRVPAKPSSIPSAHISFPFRILSLRCCRSVCVCVLNADGPEDAPGRAELDLHRYH